MSRSEFEEYGKRMGGSVALDCRKQVLETGTPEELGRLAGEKLFAIRETIERFMYESEKFKTGFFDGFLEKANQIKDAREGI